MHNNDLYNRWRLIIAIGLSIVAIGTLLDFCYSKQAVKKLHSRLNIWSKYLRDDPLNTWEVKIAKLYITIIESLLNKVIEFLVIGGNLMELPLETLNKKLKSTFLEKFGFYIIYYPIFFLLGWHLVGILKDYAWISAACTMFLLSPITYFIALFLKLSEKYNSFLTQLSACFFISYLFSLFSILISLHFIPAKYCNSYWFIFENGKILPYSQLYPLTLFCINLPFDIVTLLVSLYLLKTVIKKEKYIGIAAIIDILLSIALIVILYSCILAISSHWDFSNFIIYLQTSIDWFKKMVSLPFEGFLRRPSTTLDSFQDLHLLPILLSTFLPVTFYMSIFLFVSMSKPIMIITAKCFSVIGGKDESVFKQFAILITSFLVAIKAIYDCFAPHSL
jgi:hypothetical protein